MAQSTVRLAQNLSQQPAKRKEACELATRALLTCAVDPECAQDALKVLIELQDAHVDQVIAKARQRYPSLTTMNMELPKLWAKAQQWIHAPKKDLHAGLAIFTQLCQMDPSNYWAHALRGGCLLWTGKPGAALEELQVARTLDPLLPHAYSMGAQAHVALGQQKQAVVLVQSMLDRDGLKVGDNKDHQRKIREALETCKTTPQYAAMEATARILFPQLY